MNNLQDTIDNYLLYCASQKMLDKKTLKAYRIDLKQFLSKLQKRDITDMVEGNVESSIDGSIDGKVEDNVNVEGNAGGDVEGACQLLQIQVSFLMAS